MDVRQTCAGWKKFSPGAPLSGLHICAPCGRRAGTSQPVNENMQSWKTYWQTRSKRGGGEKNWCIWKLKGRLLDSMPSTQPLFLLFFPPQLPSYLFGCEMTWKAAVRFASGRDIKTSRHILKKKRERCNEPLLREEPRFEVLLIINSFSACFCWIVLLIMLKDSELFST